MYSVKLGFSEATRRIDALLAHGHSAEALVTPVFTVEKTVRRALPLAIVARGFTSKNAGKIIGDRSGFSDLERLWPCFSHDGQPLPAFVGNRDWATLKRALTMRNKLVHGTRAFTRDACADQAAAVLELLGAIRNKLLAGTGMDPWARLPVRRKPILLWVPNGRLTAPKCAVALSGPRGSAI